MTREENNLLTQLAQDVGYIRAQIEGLVSARLPDRMTFVEGQQKIQNQRIIHVEGLPGRVFKYILLTVPVLSGAAAVAVTIFIH